MNTGGKCILVTTVILLVSFTPLRSHALDCYWNGGTGSWDDPSNWSPNGIPGITYFPENIYITNTSGTNAIAYFANDAVDIDPDSLQVYGTGAGTMTLSISDGGLYSWYAEIGYNGIINQIGGSFMNYSDLRVDAGGTYNLQAGNLFSGLGASIIYGVFNQAGGSIWQREGMHVGEGGVYNLSGTGVLTSDWNNGVAAGGVFNQNGGTARAAWGVYVMGTYNLIAGEVEAWSNGGQVSGTFNQSGGTAFWQGDEDIPASASLCVGSGFLSPPTETDATYNLSGGRLEAWGIFIDDKFNYSGGEMVLGEKINESWV